MSIGPLDTLSTAEGMMNAAHSLHDLAGAFEVIASAAGHLEEAEPADGKNVAYYVGHFGRAEGMGHKRWFAAELCKYARGLGSEL